MDSFIARQPIFDRNKEVWGYELLFRSGLENVFNHPDPDQAASRVIADSTILFGMETLTGGKRAFINLTRDALLNDYATLLPKDWAVFELLETVEPDKPVIDACIRLKELGYTLALDDFFYHPKFDALIDLVDIIKIDFLVTTGSERERITEQLIRQNKRLIAEKVEQQVDFDDAYQLGYEFFQGYFFSKPVILSSRNISGNRLSHLEVLRLIHSPEVDYERLTKIIKQDLPLTYKLLRFTYTEVTDRHREIHTVREAIQLLGDVNLKRWATLLSLSSSSEQKPSELSLNATIRARMCEIIASKAGYEEQAADFFLLGAFSLIDAIMDSDRAQVLQDLPLTKEIKDALIHRQVNIYRKVLDTVQAYEQGKWQTLFNHLSDLQIDKTTMPNIYMQAVKWAANLSG